MRMAMCYMCVGRTKNVMPVFSGKGSEKTTEGSGWGMQKKGSIAWNDSFIMRALDYSWNN